jgi:hypothetical protein
MQSFQSGQATGMVIRIRKHLNDYRLTEEQYFALTGMELLFSGLTAAG